MQSTARLGHDETDHRAFALLKFWEEISTRRRGYLHREFPGVAVEDVYDQPRFAAFRDAAVWLTKRGYAPGLNVHWHGYVQHVLEYLWENKQRPSPRHLMNEVALRKYCGGSSTREAPDAQRSDREMFDIYHRVLPPYLRGADVMGVLGLQHLARSEE